MGSDLQTPKCQIFNGGMADQCGEQSGQGQEPGWVVRVKKDLTAKILFNTRSTGKQRFAKEHQGKEKENETADEYRQYR
ncbi:MAG: hypothetical protein Q8M96_00150 [Rubrivivax sp.]|nr:hypothetical protein [Rubrivivax sp.]